MFLKSFLSGFSNVIIRDQGDHHMFTFFGIIERSDQR